MDFLAITLRPSCPDDRDYILVAQDVTAAMSYGRGPSASGVARCRRRVDRALDAGQVMIAIARGERIGYYWIEREGENESARLLDFYVDERYRGQGIAQLLLKRLREDQIRVGVTVLRFTISDRNPASILFFTRQRANCLDSEASHGLREYELFLELFA